MQQPAGEAVQPELQRLEAEAIGAIRGSQNNHYTQHRVAEQSFPHNP